MKKVSNKTIVFLLALTIVIALAGTVFSLTQFDNIKTNQLTGASTLDQKNPLSKDSTDQQNKENINNTTKKTNLKKARTTP